MLINFLINLEKKKKRERERDKKQEKSSTKTNRIATALNALHIHPLSFLVNGSHGLRLPHFSPQEIRKLILV